VACIDDNMPQHQNWRCLWNQQGNIKPVQKESSSETAKNTTYYKYEICSEMHNAYHNREGNRRARSTTVASEQATTTKHTVNLLQAEDIKLRLHEARA